MRKIIPIINVKLSLPTIFSTIKLIIMALCCFGLVLDNLTVVKIMLALIYIVLVHLDINMYIEEGDVVDNESEGV